MASKYPSQSYTEQCALLQFSTLNTYTSYHVQHPHFPHSIKKVTRIQDPLTGQLANNYFLFSSDEFSHSVDSNSLWPHGLQHTRPPCPSPTPGACSNSCPSSQWCHPTISSSVLPFSSCLQSFTASRFFPMSQFFTSGGQSMGVSTCASVLPVDIKDWFPLGLTGLISLLSKGLSRVFFNTKCKSTNVLSCLYGPTLTSIHDSWTNHSFD